MLLLHKIDYCLMIIFTVIFLLIGGEFGHSDSYITAAGQSANQIDSQTNFLSLDTLVENGAPYLGNISSPITLIDFSDFQCYLCNRFAQNTEPLLNETYIQRGKMALVFKHLPNRGFDSMGAALATQCANDQGKFWQFHNFLYNNQEQIDSGWVSKDNLKKFALVISALDVQKFNLCLDSEKYKVFVENDIKLALSFGFRETPSFIVVNRDGSNPEFLHGALPFPSFKAVIDKKLSEVGK